MRFLKTILIFTLIVTMLSMSFVVNAESTVTYNKDTYILTVEAEPNVENADADISLFMHLETSNDVDMLTGLNLKALSPYFYESKADENGNVKFEFPFSGVTGDYKIYMASSIYDTLEDKAFFSDAMWLISKNDLIATLSGLNTAITNKTVSNYIENENVRKILNIEEIYDFSEDKTLVSETIEGFGNVESYADFDIKIQKLSELAALEKEIKELDVNTVWTQIKPLVNKCFSIYAQSCEQYTYYSSLSDTSVIDKNMLKNIPFNGLKDFYEKFLIHARKPENNGGAVSGGGGGGGGSSVSGPITIVGDINNPEKKDEQQEPIQTNGKFSDVDKSHWAEFYINKLVELNIVNGMGDNRFMPEENVTREQFIKMILSATGVDVNGSDCNFTDVDKNEWYYNYVAKAYDLGVVNGYEDLSFGIGENISREDMCAMAYRVILSMKNEGINADSDIAFTDKENISAYAVNAIKFMSSAKIVSGYTDGSFMPQGTANRAEACKIIYMIYEYMNK